MSAALALCAPPITAATVQPRLWLTFEQVCKAAGCSPNTLRRAKDRVGLTTRPGKIGLNGKPVPEVLVESLRPDLRAKVEAKYLTPGTHRMSGVSTRPPTEVAPLFAAAGPGQRPAAAAPLALPPEALRLAEARLAVILPLHEFQANRERYAALRLKDGRAVTTVKLLATHIAETQKLGGKFLMVRTLLRWLARYREGGLTALARKPREDKGTIHFFTRYPAAAQLVAAEYCKPFATAERAHRAILRSQELLQVPDAELPSYETVRRYLETLPRSMTIFAREGQRRYNETCLPHLTRSYSDIQPGSIYTSDHMIHDVEVRNDCFVGVEQDAPMRLRFTAIMCLSSRKIVGYAWTAEGDSRSIATALRRAVERYGVPHTFYCDNGQDFKKVAKGALHTRPTEESIMEGTERLLHCGALQQLGIQAQACLPYHPQSKNIERAFRTLHARLDAIFLGYLTGNSYNRPDAAILAGSEHRKLLKQGMARYSKLIPASMFIKLAETWIEQDYNAEHKHRGQGMNGRTPNQVFDAGNPIITRRSADPGVLAILLFERRTALVRRTAITVNKRRYMPVGPADWAALHNANDRQVIVAYDPWDADRAVALSQDGRQIAQLQVERLSAHPLTPTPESREQIAEMSQIRGRLAKSTSITLQTMHQQVALAGHKSDLQDLADRALAMIPVTDLVSQKVPQTGPEEPAERKQMHSADIGARLAAGLARRK